MIRSSNQEFWFGLLLKGHETWKYRPVLNVGQSKPEAYPNETQTYMPEPCQNSKLSTLVQASSIWIHLQWVGTRNSGFGLLFKGQNIWKMYISHL